jgi:hypothetical protein
MTGVTRGWSVELTEDQNRENDRIFAEEGQLIECLLFSDGAAIRIWEGEGPCYTTFVRLKEFQTPDAERAVHNAVKRLFRELGWRQEEGGRKNG